MKGRSRFTCFPPGCGKDMGELHQKAEFLLVSITKKVKEKQGQSCVLLSGTSQGLLVMTPCGALALLSE